MLHSSPLPHMQSLQTLFKSLLYSSCCVKQIFSASSSLNLHTSNALRIESLTLYRPFGHFRQLANQAYGRTMGDKILRHILSFRLSRKGSFFSYKLSRSSAWSTMPEAIQSIQAPVTALSVCHCLKSILPASIANTPCTAPACSFYNEHSWDQR